MPYTIRTARETYSVDDAGNIGRPSLRMPPSGRWKALALVRNCNFGTIETIHFADWPAALPHIAWLFKKGKPRWTLRDCNHGTTREWGSGVLRVEFSRSLTNL